VEAYPFAPPASRGSGLPDDYNNKTISPEMTVEEDGVKKRNNWQIDVGYVFNPFGDIKFSMVGSYLTLWLRE
jgi:hypothetical protein